MGKKFQFDFSKQEEQIKKDSEKKSYKDERFWNLTHDENGEAMAIIRFVPAPDGTCYQKFYTHSFKYNDEKGQQKWYIDNCVSTFGYDRQCPICEKNNIYWKSAFEKDQEIAGERKRKLFYVANIYVVKNPNKPEDEGKTFLFRFGPKIWDKIKTKWFPSANDLEDPDFKQFIPFDLYNGANFKLKGENLDTKKNKRGVYPNYDKSEFSPQSAFLAGDDKKIEKVMDSSTDLAEFVDEEKFPKNEKVIKTLACILGGTPAGGVSDDSGVDNFDMDDNIPDFDTPSLPSDDEAPVADSDDTNPDDDWFEQFDKA